MTDLKPLKYLSLRWTSSLITTYGHMTPNELETNEKRLEQEFNVDNGIESLWHHISEIQTLVAGASKPIPNSAVLHHMLQVLENTRLYTQGCHDWCKHPIIEHTLENFIAHFPRGCQMAPSAHCATSWTPWCQSYDNHCDTSGQQHSLQQH